MRGISVIQKRAHLEAGYLIFHVLLGPFILYIIDDSSLCLYIPNRLLNHAIYIA